MPRASAEIYFERQTLHPIVLLAALPSGVIGLGMFLYGFGAPPESRASLLISGVVGLAISVLLVNLRPMTIRIAGEEIYVRFGGWVPYYWKRIPLSRIASVRPVEYRPIADAGGWGIRFGKFEKARTTFLNARGRRGVLLTGDGLCLILGSQRPEVLLDAIASAIQGR